MLLKSTIFYFIQLILTSKANQSPGKMVQISESQLNELNAKANELTKLKQQQSSLHNDTTHLRNENKQLKGKVQELEEDYESQERKTWALMWFRWLAMIKNEIEWRETAVTNFTYNRNQFLEEKPKHKRWTEDDEHRRQIWNHILGKLVDNTHIASLVHEIDKTGIENDEFSKNIAIGYRELASRLLSMMRWRNLPKFEKQPTFNSPITWSPEVDKCLKTLMFDVDKYVVWEFKTELPIG